MDGSDSRDDPQPKSVAKSEGLILPRKIPEECPVAPDPRNRASLSYEIEIVTPMVGGGVKAGVNDLSYPIRVTAIRGQLRQWWRMTAGRRFRPDTAALWRREEEIFGSTDFPSPLEVRVVGQPQLRRFTPLDEYDRFSPNAYALFPSIENNQQVAREGMRFTIDLVWSDTSALDRRRKDQNERLEKERKDRLPDRIDDIGPEIAAALEGWLTYGGLGGRTRRGCGSVALVDAKKRSSTLPRIDARIFLGPPVHREATSAWADAIAAYQRFRQTPRGKKHPKTIHTKSGPKTIKVPGRSHWPEADSIRLLTGCSLKPGRGTTEASAAPADENPHDHSTPVVPRELLPAFPRARLGLPINFHFADCPGRGRAGDANKDPQDVQLVPLLQNAKGEWDKAERMASPVITRPLWVDGDWRPGIIIFNDPLPAVFQARLEGKRALADGRDCERVVAPDQIAGPRLNGVEPMRGQQDAIRALIAYLSGELCWEER